MLFLMFTREQYHKALVLIWVVVPFLAVLYAIVLVWNKYVFWSDIALMLSIFAVTALGVTIGYHRMLTHDGFKCSKWLKMFFLILGAMSFELGPSQWAATHTEHHVHSDEEGDPHSPLDGFWHAHFGWMFIYHEDWDVRKYGAHFVEDPIVRFVDKTTPLWMIVSLIIPYLIGGWTGLLWGGPVRIFLTTHVTWSVNSVCHTFGKRPFETTDRSMNNWIVGLLAFGEGWHNNHHAFPRNAFHGMRWWQFDLSGYIIRTLESVGLVWDVQRVSHEAEEAHRAKADTMRGAIMDLKDQLMHKLDNAQKDLQVMLSALPSMADGVQAKKIKQTYNDTLKRLQEIYGFASTTSMMKKPRLKKYLEEVEQLVTEAKQCAERQLLHA